MAIFQHLYTSFVNPATNEGGFRTKAVSPGLPPELVTAVLRLISYRIPPTMDEREAGSHPVALRYSVVGARDGVISLIRSCGSDENGRPGNFLAHSLIFEVSEVGDVQPALLWEHPNWSSSDLSAIGELPVLARLDWSPAIDGAEVTAFLSNLERRHIVGGLLTAIASSASRGGRRAVIVDSPRNVALWVAAVCSLLPASLRLQLTFATYHHDPYQASWLITGTALDSTFQLGPQDFLQYFVIEAGTGRTSEQAPGAHAMAVDRRIAAPDELAGYLSFCDRRLVERPLFDGRLDRIAEAYEILARSAWDDFQTSDLAALGTLLEEMAASSLDGAEYTSDLVLSLSAVRAALVANRDPKLFSIYRRAATIARRRDPVFEAFIDDELRLVATEATDAHADAKALLADLIHSYGEPAVRLAIDTAPFLMGSLRGGQSVKSLTALWDCFGRLLFPDNGRSEAVDLTLSAVDAAAGQADRPLGADAARLVSVLLDACKARERTLLGAALARRREHGGASTELIYYTLVAALPLEQRRPWRRIVEREIDDIAIYEVQCDVRTSGDRAVSVLSHWAAHLAGDQRSLAIRAGIRLALDAAATGDRARLSTEFLKQEPVVACLESSLRQTLVRAAFADRSVEWILGETVEFIRRFAGDPALPVVDAALLEIRMAIDSRRFDDRQGALVQQRLSRMTDRAQYAKEAEVLLRPFVSTSAPLEDYGAAMRAAYVARFGPDFWRFHRSLVTGLCGRLPAAPLIRLPFMGKQSENADQAAADFGTWFTAWLKFWFTGAAAGLFQGSYVSQQFFMELPGTLEDLRKCPAWKQVAPSVATSLETEPWFPLIGRFFG